MTAVRSPGDADAARVAPVVVIPARRPPAGRVVARTVPLVATGAGGGAGPRVLTVAGAASRPSRAGAVGAIAHTRGAAPVRTGQAAFITARPVPATGEPALAVGLAVRALEPLAHGVPPVVVAVRGLVVGVARAVGGGRPEPVRVGDPDRVSVFAAQPGLLPLVRLR
ncbi:hypothetical protein [Pseudofrankia sp. DC12]|uniref:hypothetical protein n=1 Tax=Pseudofrankia sp. DC12 TaxID=683315 RepID=UPI0005F877B5|nr:hypothetical protein [Pseudofrankia sp. DC12]